MRVAAEHYTNLNWVIHPISPPTPGDKHTGKAPFEKNWAARSGQRTAEELDKFFKDTKNNIGLLCGKASGVTVIDIDDDLFLKELCEGLDTSQWIISRREGEKHRGHLFFKFNPALPSQKHHTLGIEILSDGNNCVLPPSLHYSGSRYQFNRPYEDLGALPEMPATLTGRLKALFQDEKTLKALLARSRPCFKKFMESPEKLHGGDGRRLMVALATELSAAALDLATRPADLTDALKMASRLIYREDYDQARTLKEINGLDPGRPWRCATLQNNFPEICNCQTCKFKQKSQTQAPAPQEKDFNYFLRAAQALQNRSPLIYDKAGAYWLWSDSGYRQLDETDILILFKNVMQFTGITNRQIKGELLEAVRITGREREVIPRAPAWIQFQNTVIDLETGENFQATPEYFFTSPVPHKLGDSEECPVIDKLLEEWAGPEKKQLLYEILAYSLLDAYPIHRIFCLIGSGRNGKGQFMKLLRRFLGLENVTSTELERIEESRFETAKLYQKKACFMGETNFSALSKTNRLKQLSGGDIVTGEWKRKSPFDFLNTAKIIIATNSLPETRDRTDGFYSRWLVVDFPNRFKEGQDVIDPIPEIEFSNLGRKCLRILKELLQTGGFFEEGSIEDRARAYEEKSNPVTAFLKSACEFQEGVWASQYELFEAYDHFQSQHGFRQISARQFALQLEELGYEREKNIPGVFKGFYFSGLKLRKNHNSGIQLRFSEPAPPGGAQAPGAQEGPGEPPGEELDPLPLYQPIPGAVIPAEALEPNPFLDREIVETARVFSNGTMYIKDFNAFFEFYFKKHPYAQDWQNIAGRMRLLQKKGWIIYPPKDSEFKEVRT